MFVEKSKKILCESLYTNDQDIKTTVTHAIAGEVANVIVEVIRVSPEDYGMISKKMSFEINELAIINRPYMELLINEYIKLKTGSCFINKLKGVPYEKKSFLDIFKKLNCVKDLETINKNILIYDKITREAYKYFSADYFKTECFYKHTNI